MRSAQISNRRETMKKLILIALCAFAYSGCGDTTSSAVEENGSLSADFPSVKESGPVHESKNCIVESVAVNGEAELTVPLDTPEDAVMVVLGEESPALKSASKAIKGTAFDEPELRTMNLPSVGVNYSLSSMKAGSRAMKLSNLKKSSFKAIISQPKSPLSLYLKVTPLAARSGEPVTVEATIADDRTPAQAAVVTVYNGNIVVLRDDGAAPDAAAADGVYTGSFAAPEVAAFAPVNLSVQAIGTRYNGTSFSRNSFASIMVNPAGTAIDASKVSSTKETLVIPVIAENAYDARIDVIYGNGASSIAYAKKGCSIGEGSNEISIARSEESLSADRAVIRILNSETKGLEEEIQVALTPYSAMKSVKASASATAKATLPASKKRAALLYGN